MTPASATQVSGAYEFAERLHSHFFNDPDVQARETTEPGEVRADIAQPSRTERLTIKGVIDGQSASQQLSRSRKTGHFYLSTVFAKSEEGVLRERITEKSPEEAIEILEASLFMDTFRRNAQISLF